MGPTGVRRPVRPASGWRPGRAPAVLAALVIAIAGCASPTPTPPPSASSAATSPVPASTASAQPSLPAPTASPSGDPGAWTPVEPSGLPQPATLVPTQMGGDTVARTTAFVLTSLSASTSIELARRVVATPAVEFSVAGASDGSAVLTPTVPLTPSTRYRLSLVRADGTVEASWLATASGPLRIASSIPGDQATGVPLNAGVEISFDQAGVTGPALASHFSISPTVRGRFEAKGRSVVFIPSAALKKATLYTVTISKGLTVAGTGEQLERDQVIRFETGGAPAANVWMRLPDALVDATPRERASFAVDVSVHEGNKMPTTIAVTAHRLAGFDAAVAAWRAISRTPEWTATGSKGPVATTGLTRVVSASLRLHELQTGGQWVQLPRALASGWYIVTARAGNYTRQLVLQVTDTATYSLVTSTKTVVWVNDLQTRQAVAGATATLEGSTLAGSTDANGLLQAVTPASVTDMRASTLADQPAEPLLVVTRGGAKTFRPIEHTSVCAGCWSDWRTAASGDTWWSLLDTDRTQYRQTDTLHAFGVVRQRSTGTAPKQVSIALVAGYEDDAHPIATASATADSRGMYSASLKFADLPTGQYRITAAVGDERVGETWVDVAIIRKPAYTLSVTTDRHAIITGQRVKASVAAAFFDGTPVAGVGLTVGNADSGGVVRTSTNASGQASGTIRLKQTEDQNAVVSIDATPRLPEEAEVAASSAVMVFAGSAYITLDATAGKSVVEVKGAVNSVAFSRYEAAGASFDTVDPRGDPRAGAAVELTVVAHTYVTRQVGTAYNFITKQVEPKYEVTNRDITISHRTVRTAANGSFRITAPLRADAYGYAVEAVYRDEAGRRIATSAWAQGFGVDATGDEAMLMSTDGHADTHEYAVGDTIGVKFVGGAGQVGTPRYLYTTLRQGLQSATISSAPAFETVFTAESVPNLWIAAARFNGSGYDVVANDYWVGIDPRTRTLEVALTTDKSRYQPGETAKVSIRTVDPSGRPVAASVFVRAVDEKLYAIGAADDEDPVRALYAPVSDGIIGAAQSHTSPQHHYGQGGDTTGGGGDAGRSDFRDWLIAKVVQTDADGRGSVAIPLSDDLTSWRVVATAVDAKLNAGMAQANLAVGLPFFVDAVLAPEYLSTDRPVLRVRSFGRQLPTGTHVTFTVSSDTLPLSATTLTADAFASAYLTLPALTVGEQKLSIAARAVVNGKTVSDAMVRTFTVVDHRATQMRTTRTVLTGATPVSAGTGMTQVVLVDAGRGRVIPVLEELAWPGGTSRADEELASALANRVLKTEFSLPSVFEPDPAALSTFATESGLAIVSWGSGDLDLTVLAAITHDPRLPRDAVASLIDDVATDTHQSRARRMLALAGQAALGEPVLAQIRQAATAADLTVEEQVDIALAAFVTGDEALAGRLEQQILAQHAVRRGGEVKLVLDGKSGPDATVLTARLAIVAASLGDQVAADMDAWVAAHPSSTTLVVLERALAASGWARRVPSATAVAALTVDGSRRDVTIDRGAAVQVQLTPAQAATARVEPVSGPVLMVQTWDAGLTPSSLTAPAGVTVTRTVSPSGAIGATDTLVVTYRVTLPRGERDHCWRLVDFVPSGLAPVAWYGNAEMGRGMLSPTVIDGQRVEFCAGDIHYPTQSLRYLARVVTPGTFTWEPAVLQSTMDPKDGVIVPATTITIRTPRG